MRIPSGTTDQYIYFVAVDSTDFATRETGLSSFTVYRSRDGAAAAAMTTPTINETDATNMPGVYELLLDEDMTIAAGNDSEEMVFHITATGMAPVTRTIELYRPKITAGNTLGVASDGDVSGNVDGNVVGSVASVTAAITLPTIPSNWITASGIAASALDSKGDWALASVLGALTDAAAAGDPTTADTAMQYLKQLVNVLVGTAGIATFPAEAAPANAVSLAEVIRAIHADVTGLNGDAMRGTDSASTLTAAQVNAEVDTALADINLDHLVGTATGIPAVPAGTFLDQIMDDGTATFDRTTDSLQAIRDRGDAAWTTGAGGTPPDLLQSTTIATLASQTSFTLTAGSADDDAYNGQIAIITDSATSTQKAVASISDYVGSTKTVTLSADPAIFTMAVGDTIEIIAATGSAGSAPTAAQVADAVWDEATAGHTTAGTFGEQVATDIDAILADTNELQTDDVPGLIAALNDPTAAAVADAVWDESTTGHITAGTFGEQVKTDVDAILADTAELQADWANGGRLDLLVDQIISDIAALNNVSVAQINAEMVDALNTDTYAEPGQGAPGATISLAAKIGYLYKAWRNKTEQTASQLSVYDDAGTTVDQKSTVSDDGTTATRGEIVSGP